MRSLLLLLLSLLVFGYAAGADAGMVQPLPGSQLTSAPWSAHWITHPTAPKNEYGVWLYRKTFELPSRPDRFVVHVTGDARYELWVNGESVGFGPQRSDAWVLHYDSVDLAPWLRSGANVIAARVISYGEHGPYATTAVRTGFIVQGDSATERIVDTGATWRVLKDESFTPVPVVLPTYIVVGAGVRIDGTRHPWGWQQTGSDDARWLEPRVLGAGAPQGWGTEMEHSLTPRTIPPMERALVRFGRIRRSDGIVADPSWLQGHAPLTVPAHTRATLLLDQTVETNAFPRVVVSAGRGSRIKLTYAEALTDSLGHKGHRDEIEGRTMAGVTDEFLPDGGSHRTFTSFDFRTYRYVEVAIETGDEPLQLEDVYGEYTTYPFKEVARFTSDDPALKQVWDVGWRTARLCAFETYMDCPYYEQLQYVGDTRIQSFISLYVSGDDRLMRNAIELFDRSRIAEGLTQSRYPSITPQVINTFSLFWVDMVHDYWMHRTDDDFIRQRLTGIQAVLSWFENRVEPRTGMLGPLTFWTFVDWTKEWPWNASLGFGGEPDGTRSGGSSIVSLQLAGTLGRAAELCRAMGRSELGERYDALATRLRQAVTTLCWDESRKMFADTPAKRSFSQHANTMAVLAGAIDGAAATKLMRAVSNDQSLIQASTYFRFYLLRAMKRAGLGDEYIAQLEPWRAMLAQGLTTFAEQPDPTRSDCHAWSASPVYELLATVCGVEPATPGFSTVRIEPHLGPLQQATGSVAHPRGLISVDYKREREGLVAAISLPAGVSGNLIWRGEVHRLAEGNQTLRLP